MKVIRFLDREGIPFKWLRSLPPRISSVSPDGIRSTSHSASPPTSYCAVKTQLVKYGDVFYLCVLPEHADLDLDLVARAIGIDSVAPAEEEERAARFEDCEADVAPPFGNLYGLPTLMDAGVEGHDYLLCSVGTREDRVRLRLRDFEKLVSPSVAPITHKIP